MVSWGSVRVNVAVAVAAYGWSWLAKVGVGQPKARGWLQGQCGSESGMEGFSCGVGRVASVLSDTGRVEVAEGRW